MMARLFCSLLLLIGCVPVAGARAQAGLFTVTGLVLDQNDAVVADARVALRGDGQRRRSTATDAAGAFRFERLAAGDYEIEVSRDGFKAITERLTIGSRQPAPLRIILPVADVRQDVTVSDASAQVNTDAGGNQDGGQTRHPFAGPGQRGDRSGVRRPGVRRGDPGDRPRGRLAGAGVCGDVVTSLQFPVSSFQCEAPIQPTGIKTGNWEPVTGNWELGTGN